MSVKAPSERAEFCLNAGPYRMALGRETKIMGVLNVTPDSFSDGGLFLDPGLALEHALKMQSEGAHLLDVGGESSRPGAGRISSTDEIKRIRPVLKRLASKIQIPISVDSYKEDVVRMALDEGAVIINDITGLAAGKGLGKLAASYKAGLVLMHMRGTPQTMQKDLRYKNLLSEVLGYLENAVSRALDAGVKPSSIVVDPGFGFGKSAAQNVELLTSLDRLAVLGKPVLAGLSRKSFIGHVLDAPVEGRLYGSIGAAALAILRGAHILRVHDVLPHCQAARLADLAYRPAEPLEVES